MDLRPRCEHHVVFPDDNCIECLKEKYIDLYNWYGRILNALHIEGDISSGKAIEKMFEIIKENEQLKGLMNEKS